jgi:hypothetical protein
MNGIFVALSWCAALVFASEPASCGEQPKCESARRALIAAESAVEEAIAKQALWTTARSALAEARAAFAQGHYEIAAQAAARAEELGKLGIAQTREPPFPQP